MIAAALIQYYSDAKMWPIYRTFNDIPNGQYYDLLRGPGYQSAVSTPAPDWNLHLNALNGTTSLDSMLNTNFFGLQIVGSTGVWKGSYLELGPDPWGGSYYVTSGNLRLKASTLLMSFLPGRTRPSRRPITSFRRRR
jgi:hypothetical protein